MLFLIVSIIDSSVNNQQDPIESAVHAFAVVGLSP